MFRPGDEVEVTWASWTAFYPPLPLRGRVIRHETLYGYVYVEFPRAVNGVTSSCGGVVPSGCGYSFSNPEDLRFIANSSSYSPLEQRVLAYCDKELGR